MEGRSNVRYLLKTEPVLFWVSENSEPVDLCQWVSFCIQQNEKQKKPVCLFKSIHFKNEKVKELKLTLHLAAVQNMK
jgi:hypothetical protein